MDKNRLPELTGANYAYWKARTKMHLKAKGERVWRAILTGWDHPTKAGTTPEDPPVLKPEIDWTNAEMTLANYNNHALDAIFSLMHEDQFTLIAGCNSAKEAWEILETTYERKSSVKQSKLQLVQSDFEQLKMKDEETIVDFHARIQELANLAMVLGEPFPQPKLIKKILRSLPQRFRMKVTAIQEHEGWENKSVAQLMGNLQTYEMEILADRNKKEKDVSFAAEELDFDFDLDECNDDQVVLLTKQFSKFLKQVKQRNNTRGGKSQNHKGSSSNSSKNTYNSGSSNRNYNKVSSSRSSQSKEKSNSKGIRCFECEGYGHVQAECPTYLRRKKSMAALTWSDDETESEAPEFDTEEILDNFVAFTAVMHY